MKKSAVILLFLTISFLLQSQPTTESSLNEYFIGFNGSYVTSGDQYGFHFSNEYHRLISAKFYFGVNFGILYCAKGSDILSNEPPPGYVRNLATGDWGFTDEDGLKILDLKTDQQLYTHFDLLLLYKIFKISRFEINASIGSSIAYISNTFITRWELGVFESELGTQQNLQLVYPYYSRLIDIGITGKININYNLSDSFSLGLIVGISNYFKSGYRYYDLGLQAGIKF